MANSYTSATGTGALQTVTVPAYIDQAHIKVNINNVAYTGFTWVNASTVRLTAPLGAFVKVFRSTSPNTRLVDYIDGVPLDEVTLDTDSKQAFYLAQEQLDATQDALVVIGQPNFQAIADDITAKSVIASTGATAATAQAVIAATQAGNAAASVTSAATQAGNSAASATAAAAQVGAATTQAGNAATSATAAAASATAAANSATASAGSATSSSGYNDAAYAAAVAAQASAVASAASAASVVPTPPVRQTVLEGPVDANGYPNFGGAVGSATLTAAATLKVTAMAGGDSNRNSTIVNPAFTAPAGSGTGFLMVSISPAGVATASVRTLAPIYQFGGTYGVAAGQFTCNTQEGTSKAGNGTTASQVVEVCIGECPYTAGVWSGAPIWYALRGVYDSGLFAVTGGYITYAKSANVGSSCDLFVYFSTTASGLDGGGTTNEEVPYGGTGDSANPNYRGMLFGQATRNILRVKTQDIFQLMDAAGNQTNPSSGYVRIRALRRHA